MQMLEMSIDPDTWVTTGDTAPNRRFRYPFRWKQ